MKRLNSALLIAMAAGLCYSDDDGNPVLQGNERGMKCISPIFSSMRGKIGGAVASRARGAEITLRALAIPRNPFTAMQALVRNAITSLSTYWRDALTESQQEAWWDIASGSETGKGIFTKVNQPRAQANGLIGTTRQHNNSTDVATNCAILPEPPPIASYTDGFSPSYVIDDSANTLTITFPAGQLDLFTAAAAPGEPACILVYASHQQSSGALSRAHPLSVVGVITMASDGAVTASTITINLAALGYTTQTGKVMYVRCVGTTALGSLVRTGEERVTITA